MNTAAWGMRGGRKRRPSAVRWQAASNADIARSFFSGAIILQISGSCAAVLMLQTWRRIYSSAPHRSFDVTACLMRASGGAIACIWKGC